MIFGPSQNKQSPLLKNLPLAIFDCPASFYFS
jgi:hypothetical protein